MIRKSFSPTTDQAGGGHAHSGLLIYQGENWPARYRDTVLTVNLHGRRLNNDRLERRGSSYVGRHAPDLLRTSDPWFRAIDLIDGPDGGVYLADWCDIGECHENDGVHRTSGRIFKVTHGTPPRPEPRDVAALDDLALVRLQADRNEWYVRQARRVLQERAAAGKPMTEVHAALGRMFREETDVRTQLRALWGLYVTGGTTRDWLRSQLDHPNEHVRAWVVRLLVDDPLPAPAQLGRLFTARAASEPSGLVLLYLASALQKLAPADRWALAGALASRTEYAGDPALPYLIWYGVEPAVPEASARAVALAGSSEMPLVTRFVARRLTEDLKLAPGPVDGLLSLVARSDDERRRAVLEGMAEALRGWRERRVCRDGTRPARRCTSSGDATIARLARELSVVFGDGRAIDDLLRIVAARDADLAARRDAIQVTVAAQAAECRAAPERTDRRPRPGRRRDPWSGRARRSRHTSAAAPAIPRAVP